MRILKIGVAFFPFLVGASLSAQTISNVTKITYTTSSRFLKGGVTTKAITTTQTRYISPNGVVRTESTDEHGKTTVELESEAEDYRITLDDQSKSASRLNGIFHAAHTGALGSAGTKVDVGKAVIQGYSCEGYSNTFGEGVVLKHWECKDPETGVTFTGRFEAMRGSSVTEQTIVSVSKHQTLPSVAFEIPPGYTTAITDAALHGGGATVVYMGAPGSAR